MTPFFPCAHAAHPLWQHATRQVIVQLHAQSSMQKLPPHQGLGLVYVSAAYAPYAGEIIAALSQAMPEVKHWVGSAVHSVLAGDLDYGHSGALAVMLPMLAEDAYQVFSGVAPWRPGALKQQPQAALVHGDAASMDLALQLQTLMKHLRCEALTGGICDLQGTHAQWAWGGANSAHIPASIGGGGVQVGGFSGVAFGPQVELLSIGMKGCRATGNMYTVTAAQEGAVLALDGRPALEVLFGQLDWHDTQVQADAAADKVWERIQNTLVALSTPQAFGADASVALATHVLPVVGVDPVRQALLVEGAPRVGQTLSVCLPDDLTVRNDARRACAEVWEMLTPDMQAAAEGGPASVARSICGAVYIRSQNRSALPRTPQVDAELQLIRHALGPVPLLGFTSTYEVQAGALQRMSAQLLVFTQPLHSLS